jgi:hypothetical protein
MNLAVLGLVTSYEVVFDLCRKRGSRDLLQQGELRAILCGAWRFRPIWDYNQSKDCPRASSKKGTIYMHHIDGICLLSLFYIVFTIIPYKFK